MILENAYVNGAKCLNIVKGFLQMGLSFFFFLTHASNPPVSTNQMIIQNK